MTGTRDRLLIATSILFLVGCTHVALEPTETTVRGYLRYAGEFMIFSSPNPPPDDLTNRPRCLSGVPAGDLRVDLKQFDGKLVFVKGRIVPYKSLPDEGGVRGAILPRKIADGAIVANYCRSLDVLIASSIEVVN